MVHWRDLIKISHESKFQSALFCTLGVIAHGKSIATHRLLMVDVQPRHQEFHGEDRGGRGLNGEEGMRKRRAEEVKSWPNVRGSIPDIHGAFFLVFPNYFSCMYIHTMAMDSWTN